MVSDGFPFSKTDTGESSGRFVSPKPEQPEPDRSYKKIQPNPAKTSQIRRDLDQIRLYMVGFSQIWPNPTISSEKKCRFQKKSVSSENFPNSDKNFQFPAKVPDFGNAFFHISMPFLIPATDPTRPTLTITENRTDRFFRRLVSSYSTPPSDADRSSPGWVKNRPGPTRGQP